MAVFGGLVPSTSSQKTTKYRVNEYQYGMGYKATSPDGANGVLLEWQLNFDDISATQAAALEAWLVTIPPWVIWAGDGTHLPSTKKFKITADGYQVTYKGGGVASYQFLAEQAF